MSKNTKSDTRQNQITNALISVMATRGYKGASINQIAKEADITPGLIHYHFKNKQEILLAALDLLVSRHDRRLTEELVDAGPRDKVARFINLHLGLGAHQDRDSLACWVVIGGEALQSSNVQEAYSAAVTVLVTRLERIIRDGCESGEFHCASPPAAAAAIIATIQGYFTLAAVSPALIPRRSAARSALAMAAGLLGASFDDGKL